MDKQHRLDQLFAGAKQDQAIQSFEQTKERFISSLNTPVVNQSKTKQVFTKKWIIMLTTVSTICLSFLFLLNNNETKPAESKTENRITKQQALTTKVPGHQQTLNPKNNPVSIPPKTAPLITVLQELLTEQPFPEEKQGTAFIPADNAHPFKFNPPNLWDEPYQFPVLTEEEIAITKKKKKSMLKALAKHDKNAYVFVPSGSFDYNGKTVSAQAFYIGIGEVTNFEYRTFLFDLIIQGRKDDFLKAKPDQSAWLNFPSGGYPGFKEHYFSEKTFNEYPVVNISREGAELYCKWLSQEVRAYVGDEKEGKYNDVRLPIRAEWVKAASNEGKQLPYPWNGPYLRNSRGLFQANFTHDIVKDQIDTTGYYKMDISHSDITAPSKSFWPNALGIYNMSGNVAEMVYEGMDKTEPGTAGGSWRSSGQEIQIYAPDPDKGITDAKATIGFRVVSTYLTQPKK